VALHIHERISARARKSQRESVQRDLFATSDEVHCLLGDNGAGKSTLIKILSGVHMLTQGRYEFEGKPVELSSPREALDMGIATVFQDLAMLPLMSITRNFFLGREPTKKLGPVEVFDSGTASKITNEELNKIGIKIRDPDQAVGTLSGGERQAVAIARAVYFGARVLILDEPTSALTGPKPTPATPLPVSVPAREKCVMPPGLDNPVDVQKFLDGCNSQDLVDLLSTEKGKSATGKLRFQLCYRESPRCAR
jgi:ABC-type branched-subunit amino acid transport system ATPase component